MALIRARCISALSLSLRILFALLAELGELELAQHELATDVANWQTDTRRLVREVIIGNDRQRFLFSETADVAPIADVVSWLDFAYEENRGYGWVDVLRTEMPHWRPDRSVNVDIWPGSRSGDRRALRETTVPTLTRLTARSHVLEGHTAQAALLAQLGTPPVVFSARIAELAPQAVDGFLIV